MTDPELQAAPPEEGETGEQHPEWFQADKYKTYEDQAKGYAEANTRMQRAIDDATRERQERERLEEQLSELSTLMQQQPTVQQQQPGFGNDWNEHPLVIAAQAAMDAGDAPRLLAVQAQLNDALYEQKFQQFQAQQPKAEEKKDFTVEARLAEQAIATKYPDEYRDLFPQIKEILDNDPSLIAETSVAGYEKGIERALRMARGDALAVQHKQSLAQQQVEQENAKRRKQDAETMSGTGPTRVAPKSEQDAAWDRISGQRLGGIRLGNVGQ